jgi:hypothetical protein
VLVRCRGHLYNLLNPFSILKPDSSGMPISHHFTHGSCNSFLSWHWVRTIVAILGTFIDIVGTFIENIGTFIDNTRTFIENIGTFKENVAMFKENVRTFINIVGTFKETVGTFKGTRLFLPCVGDSLSKYAGK